MCPRPIGAAVYLKIVLRLVPPPRSTLLAAQEWNGIISPRVFTAEGASRSVERIPVKRGISSASFVSMIRSRLALVELYGHRSVGYGHAFLNAAGAESSIHGHVVPALDLDVS